MGKFQFTIRAFTEGLELVENLSDTPDEQYSGFV